MGATVMGATVMDATVMDAGIASAASKTLPTGMHPAAAHKAIADRIIETMLTNKTRNKSGVCISDQICAIIANGVQYEGETYPDAIHENIINLGEAYCPQFESSYCSAMGRLLEMIVSEIFDARGMIGRQWDAQTARLPENYSLEHAKWKTDILLPVAANGARDTAVEVKYRYNSGQGNTRQVNGAKALKMMDIDPVAYVMRGDGEKLKSLRNGGWKVLVGDAMIDDIRQRTGIDTKAVMALVGKDRRLKAKFRAAHEERLAREREQIIRAMRRDLRHARECMKEAILSESGPDADRAIFDDLKACLAEAIENSQTQA